MVMTLFIALILFGIISAVFATQNNNWSSINLFNYVLSVPMYLIVLVSMLIGLVLAWILSLPSALSLMGKDRHIHSSDRTVEDLRKKIHNLEVENAELKASKQQLIADSRKQN